jgi:hypothetical protein
MQLTILVNIEDECCVVCDCEKKKRFLTGTVMA